MYNNLRPQHQEPEYVRLRSHHHLEYFKLLTRAVNSVSNLFALNKQQLMVSTAYKTFVFVYVCVTYENDQLQLAICIDIWIYQIYKRVLKSHSNCN